MSREVPYRVVVAEDEPLILNNICAKIERENHRFSVAGKALNGQQAWEMIERLKPDALFTDIRMPMMDGLELIRLATERYPSMQIVVISGFDDFAYAQQAIRYGVKGYLLKPVEAEEMNALLRKLDDERQSRSDGREKEQLAEALQTGRQEPDSLRQFENRLFRLSLVHFGHLAGPFASPGLASFYERLWERGSPAAMGKWPWPPSGGTILAVVARSFGRFLVTECESAALTAGGREDGDLASTGNGLEEGVLANEDSSVKHWLDELSRAVAPYPATVAVCRTPVAFQDLYEQAQALVRTIERGAVPGTAQILYPGEEESGGTVSWLRTSEQQKIGVLLQSGKKANFRKEIADLFKQWETERCPQRVVEKRLMHLLQLTHQHSLLLNEAEVSHLEYEMLYKLGEARCLSDIADDVVSLLDSAAFVEEDRDHRDTTELARHIEHYLDENFARTITLADISDQFSFSPSYITKIFKQHHGVGPLKYLISLRIEEAKRLIARHPELSFKEVGSAVGYEDPNYFSRIFKNTTGCSLTDFGRQCRGQEPSGGGE
ncbi:response regulator [Cohnella soli]|uniref:Response regulator n=1 Tax=Cohnella soli TaxID=425005 RepID=A0ABW0HUN1_9BACL